jgi:uncharacterized protein (DUF427 family)
MLAHVDGPLPIDPGPGQESVWDYPRPPRLEPTDSVVVVVHAGVVVAESRRAMRVLETSQAPAFYIPPDDVDLSLLRPSTHASFCEWKGRASYLDLVVGDEEALEAAWTYRTPTPAFANIAGWFAFYPQRVDACRVDGELVRAMDGGFYGGWVTSKVVGPFKGGPGTATW